MRPWIATTAAWTALLSASPGRSSTSSSTIWATPHEQYSSSVGVLGCKINTNRVAYWPFPISCTDICVELTHQDRSVNLLRIDQSEGAYDVSYDAWNYLYTGESARDDPTTGGPVEMTYRNASVSDCEHLIDTEDAKLPLSASNSMNFLASCLNDDDSWVADNYVLYNVLDAVCSLGHDEECDLDWPNANQADCPNTLGEQNELTSAPVYNVQYGTGNLVEASSGGKVDDDDDDDDEDSAAGPSLQSATSNIAAAAVGMTVSTSMYLIYPLMFWL